MKTPPTGPEILAGEGRITANAADGNSAEVKAQTNNVAGRMKASYD
ncbi:hypothetical protein HZF05_16395 [Sphingomonas sp. CGMCC 1.13654]|uniref:Uncharacterized protein n=1 Tax=Sphingomonas chungangi TaxID=2683589 RepID=A0A838LAD1_9SPHN|nr:hypothetical protein [Sphingomonas chungangi]MBA2935665.1 hypothetical protein [Sphingomonas chungangi]